VLEITIRKPDKKLYLENDEDSGGLIELWKISKSWELEMENNLLKTEWYRKV
jgi:hypothetical protein